MSVNKDNITNLEYLENGKVFITNNAFRKMIQHVLKFGNDSLDEKQEVMGVCLGNNDTSLNVTDIIPITHGDNVELGFGQEIIDLFNELKRQYLEKGLKIIGWYHSHLGYGIYLSNSDRVNQLAFQDNENPYAFGIVFDYKLFENNITNGFEIFRFKDPNKGPESEYGKVKYEIEKPNTMDYFKWVKNLVEDSQKKVPIIIKEYNEESKVKPEDLQEIPNLKTASFEQEIDSFDSRISSVLNGAREGMLSLNQIIGDNIQIEFSNWLKDLYTGSLLGMEQIRSSLSQMRKTILEGFEDVENYFTRTFKEISEIFIKDVSGYIDKSIENQKHLKDEIDDDLQKLNLDTFNLIESNIENFKTDINEKISHAEVKIHNVKLSNNQFNQILEKIKNDVNDLNKSIDSLTDVFKDEIDKAYSNFESNLKMQIDEMNLNGDSIIEKNKEIKSLIDRLQKVIADFRQLK